MKFECWFEGCDEQNALVEVHSASSAAEVYCRLYGDIPSDEDVFIACVRDGDTVRRFEVVARVETTFTASEVKP